MVRIINGEIVQDDDPRLRQPAPRPVQQPVHNRPVRTLSGNTSTSAAAGSGRQQSAGSIRTLGGNSSTAGAGKVRTVVWPKDKLTLRICFPTRCETASGGGGGRSGGSGGGIGRVTHSADDDTSGQQQVHHYSSSIALTAIALNR